MLSQLYLSAVLLSRSREYGVNVAALAGPGLLLAVSIQVSPGDRCGELMLN